MKALDLLFDPSLHEKYRKRARAAVIAFLAVVLVLLFLPLLTYPDPPPGQEGVLVSFGQPDVGVGADDPAIGEPAAEPEPVEEEQEEEQEAEDPPVEEITPQEEVIEESEPEPTPTPDPTPDRELNTDETSDEIAIKKREEEARKKAEEEARRKAAEEARKKAEEEARKKAEEEARKKAEADELKGEIGDLFNNNESGTGRGNNDQPGNQGDPNGGDSDILEGISTGAGRVGGGLSSRGGSGPAPSVNFNQGGVVVVRVCVNAQGKVIGDPTFTQKGSTTNEARLINAAIASAKKWSFKSGVADKQCGTITYTFKVK